LTFKIDILAQIYDNLSKYGNIGLVFSHKRLDFVIFSTQLTVLLKIFEPIESKNRHYCCTETKITVTLRRDLVLIAHSITI
jgi:hypothetical protein